MWWTCLPTGNLGTLVPNRVLYRDAILYIAKLIGNMVDRAYSKHAAVGEHEI